MTMKRTPRPRDPVQLGKLMVDIATGAVPDAVDDGKDAGVSHRMSAAGGVGGKARGKALTPERRKEIGENAAKARWNRPYSETKEEERR